MISSTSIGWTIEGSCPDCDFNDFKYFNRVDYRRKNKVNTNCYTVLYSITLNNTVYSLYLSLYNTY